jgi:hypothetical protein
MANDRTDKQPSELGDVILLTNIYLYLLSPEVLHWELRLS